MSGQSVAVIGLGAVGGVLAASLALDGRHAVTACVRRPVPRLLFRHPDGEAEVALRCLDDPDHAAPADWVLLCTKAQHSDAAGPWLRRLCRPGTRVAVLQNGLGHAERVAPHAGGAPVVPAVVYFNGERGTDPEWVRLRRVTDRDLAVPDDADGRDFAALLRGGLLDARPSADFRTLAWRKLLINAVANPLTAVTRRRQHVLRRPDMRALGLAVLAEAVAVGRAEGAALAADEVERTWALLMTYPAEAGTSMFHDAVAGRSLEVEAITGALVALGERHGIPTPVNRTLLTLLRAAADPGPAPD